MSRRRFIADQLEGDIATLVGDHAHHLTRVLRVQEGHQFEIAHGGTVRLGSVRSISDDRVDFILGDTIITRSGDVPRVTLILSIFKFDRMEWGIEKAVELGISEIIPAIAQRTEAHLAKASQKRIERWRRIAREASQQSRRSIEPVIGEPKKLKDILAAIPHDTQKILLAERDAGSSLMAALNTQSDNIHIAIGPEGGWSDVELTLFRTNQWDFASLGANTLRAETAVIAALAVIQSTTQNKS
jgi:16S rRNA (uracil1498-N3)-methyltransferase